MKADVRKDKIDKDSIAERRQQQHRHRAKDKLEKIDGLKDEDGGKYRK